MAFLTHMSFELFERYPRWLYQDVPQGTLTEYHASHLIGAPLVVERAGAALGETETLLEPSWAAKLASGAGPFVLGFVLSTIIGRIRR